VCAYHPVGSHVDIESVSGAVDSDEAFAFQMQNDLLGSFVW
jgi:hypothetical protein